MFYYGNPVDDVTEGEKCYEKNVIVGQSGGPTAVINASLAGVL